MLYEEGFKRLETAKGFSGEGLAKTMRKMVAEAEAASAGEMAVTLGYDKGAPVGSFVPEIVLKVRKVEDPDEDDEEEED